MNFEEYLQHRSLSPSSRHTYLRQVHRYLSWWEQDPQEAAYADLLAYIQHLQNLGHHPGYINQQLGAIEKYYQYLKQRGITARNPAQGLRIQGVGRTLPHALLSAPQLDQLYESYPTESLPQQRNKVMLGMIIYQALRGEELEQLSTHDLGEHTLDIEVTRKTAARTLELQDLQLPVLEEYLQTVRPQLLGDRCSSKLLVTLEGGKSLKHILASIIRRLKRDFPQLRNASQLRQSRIRCWLEEYDLREVQYRAGHRYISSTERYGMLGIKDLKAELDKYHPLG